MGQCIHRSQSIIEAPDNSVWPRLNRVWRRSPRFSSKLAKLLFQILPWFFGIRWIDIGNLQSRWVKHSWCWGSVSPVSELNQLQQFAPSIPGFDFSIETSHHPMYRINAQKMPIDTSKWLQLFLWGHSPADRFQLWEQCLHLQAHESFGVQILMHASLPWAVAPSARHYLPTKLFKFEGKRGLKMVVNYLNIWDKRCHRHCFTPFPIIAISLSTNRVTECWAKDLANRSRRGGSLRMKRHRWIRRECLWKWCMWRGGEILGRGPRRGDWDRDRLAHLDDECS